MTQLRGPPMGVEFGVFHLDPAGGELRKHGIRISLQEQPFEVLRLLLERPGELVTREEVQRDLWPDDEFGDFDQRLNVAITKIRHALGDSADSPRFIETVPRHGYRFIAPVKQVSGGPSRRQARAILIALTLLLLAGAGYLGWRASQPLGQAPTDRIMLAVLPFENLTGDPENEYFSDGLTEEIIMQLGKLSPRRLGVIARTSTKRYKETQKSIKQIGSELGVDYVLEGSVRREAGRVRIAAQLIEAADQSHLWAQAYENEMANILSIQLKVAQHVASSLAVEVLTSPALDQPPATNPIAYEAYLKGRYFRDKHTREGLEKGLEAFQLAIEKDPSYAPAYAGLASCSCLLSGHGMEIQAPKELMARAKQMALRALALDETLAEAHAVLAMAYLKYEWDFSAAELEFLRTIELNPSYARGRLWYSIFLEAMGRSEDAIVQAKIGRDLDPLSLEANINFGMQLLGAGRDAEGFQEISAALELERRFWGTHWALGEYHLRGNRYEEAVREFQQAVELSGGNTVSIASLGHAHALAGRRSEALEALQRLELLAGQRYVSPAHVAIIHAGLGDVDEAFAWLEKAYEQRSRYLVWVAVASEFQGLRSDPRYDELLGRIGLPTEG